jgi:hypothetical protein
MMALLKSLDACLLRPVLFSGVWGGEDKGVVVLRSVPGLVPRVATLALFRRGVPGKLEDRSMTSLGSGLIFGCALFIWKRLEPVELLVPSIASESHY